MEPDRDGNWWADLGPVDGPVLGPFKNRTEALGAEREWLSLPPLKHPALVAWRRSLRDPIVAAVIGA